MPGVGKNLQDRYEISVNYEFDNQWELTRGCKFGANSTSDPCFKFYEEGRQTSTCLAKRWQTNIYGTSGALIGMTLNSGVESYVPGFGKPDAPGGKVVGVPDVYVLATPLNFHGYFKGYPQEVATSKNVFSFIILKSHTNNTGTVELASLDYFDRPKINFKYFPGGSKDKDLWGVVSAVKQVRDFLGGPNTSRETKSYHPKEIRPGTAVDSDAELADYVKANAWGHHACGTAKMGPASDPYAVVDADFKVHGVNGLRIVDASVWPRIPGYFIATPTYMLSEKAADSILDYAKSQKCTRFN